MIHQAELEGEVFAEFLAAAVGRAVELRGTDAPLVRTVLDIGSGPGVGTCQLAELFPLAEVTAVDSSPSMLERVAVHASERGLGGRVHTRLGELPGGLDGLEPADVIWASMSLHHVGDEVAALRALASVLAPAGVIVVSELAEPLQVLPEDLGVGAAGLAGRIEQAGRAWFAAMRHGLPDTVESSTYEEMVAAAGLEVVEAWTQVEHLTAPLSDGARRLARDHVRRISGQVVDHLSADDLASLAILGDDDDPRGVIHRPDLEVVASRRLLIARAPA